MLILTYHGYQGLDNCTCPRLKPVGFVGTTNPLRCFEAPASECYNKQALLRRLYRSNVKTLLGLTLSKGCQIIAALNPFLNELPNGFEDKCVVATLMYEVSFQGTDLAKGGTPLRSFLTSGRHFGLILIFLFIAISPNCFCRGFLLRRNDCRGESKIVLILTHHGYQGLDNCTCPRLKPMGYVGTAKPLRRFEAPASECYNKQALLRRLYTSNAETLLSLTLSKGCKIIAALNPFLNELPNGFEDKCVVAKLCNSRVPRGFHYSIIFQD